MKIMDGIHAGPVKATHARDITNNAFACKELGQKPFKALRSSLGIFWKHHRGNASITEYDPCYKVAYLGNVLTGWANGEGCVEKPISTLWRNYVNNNRPDVAMKLTVTNGGLTATTKDHGLTEYWAHRITHCTVPVFHPRLFVWIYRHEGRKLRPELRCHAALCIKESIAKKLAATLDGRLHQALHEFRRDKISRQNARLSLANAVYENPSLPRRKILLSTGGQNYKPPLERSKSAPKLSAIVEDSAAEEIEQKRLLEEMRSLKSVGRGWSSQDGWSLARLVHALNRTAASSGEYLEENENVWEKGETGNTSNSEQKAVTPGDSSISIDSKILLDRKQLRLDQVLRPSYTAERRINFTRPPYFLTYVKNASFYYNNKLSISKNKYALLSRNETSYALEEATKRLEIDELSDIFDFEDTQVFHELVDYRPLGDEGSREMKDDADTEVEAKVGQYLIYEHHMKDTSSDERTYVGIAQTAAFEQMKEKCVVKSFDDVDVHSNPIHTMTEAIDKDKTTNTDRKLQI